MKISLDKAYYFVKVTKRTKEIDMFVQGAIEGYLYLFPQVRSTETRDASNKIVENGSLCQERYCPSDCGEGLYQLVA